MGKLLAYNGTDRNQRQGFLGRLLHDKSKWFIRRSVAHLHHKMKPVFEYKQENGWQNPSIPALVEAFDFVIECDRKPINREIGGFKIHEDGTPDVNELLFTQLRDIVCTQLDEDSHYHLRMMVFLKYVHENWEKFEIAANQADHIMRFGEIYAELLESLKRPVQDDGLDVEEVDMVELHRRVTGAA